MRESIRELAERVLRSEGPRLPPDLDRRQALRMIRERLEELLGPELRHYHFTDPE